MIAKWQQRDQDVSSKKGPRGASWLDAKLDAAAADPGRFRWIMIGIGLVGLGWVGFVAIVALRSAAMVAAPPSLVLAPPPPASVDPPDAQSKTIETVPSGSAPVIAEAQPEASDEAVPPPISAAIPPENVPLPPLRQTTGNAAPSKPAPKPAPAPKPTTVTIRTFHPPVISSWYKDMVADKMKEVGIDSRLEAKVRSGKQLSKGDLASIPRAVMERINTQVVAYGQPPLYTDTTVTATR